MSSSAVPHMAESREDAVIRVVGFCRQDQHLHMRLLAGHPVDHDGTTPVVVKFPVPITFGIRGKMIASSGMGTLGKLPSEIKIKIFRHLDVESFMSLRQTCREVREFTSDFFEFRHVVDNAAVTLLGIIRTGMWKYVTFVQIRDAMCTRHCEVCAKIGHFLYLPTMTRVCKSCLHADVQGRFRTVTLASFIREAMLTDKQVEKRLLPTVTGAFFDDILGNPRRIKLVNFARAIQVMNLSTKVDVGNGRLMMNTENQTFARHMATTPLPMFDKAAGKAFVPLRCKGCATYHRAIHTYDRGIWNPQTQPDMGLLKAAANREFLRAGFLLHAQICDKARVIQNIQDMVAGRKNVPYGTAGEQIQLAFRNPQVVTLDLMRVYATMVLGG